MSITIGRRLSWYAAYSSGDIGDETKVGAPKKERSNSASASAVAAESIAANSLVIASFDSGNISNSGLASGKRACSVT